MQPAHEFITPDPDTSFRIIERRQDRYAFSWHQHLEYELTCIIAGHGTRFVGADIKAYEGVDLVLLGPNLPHTWWAPGDDGMTQVAYCAQFTDATLGDLLQRPEGRELAELLERSAAGLSFSQPVAERVAELLIKMHLVSPLVRLGLLYEALGLLAEAKGQELSQTDLPHANDPRLARACQFVLEHINQPIQQGEVAAQVGLTPEAFARFFRRRTGRTLTEYIHRLRITQACDRLRANKESITDIAYGVGFGNLANFNRVFKRLHGMTPSAYRKRWSATT